MIIQKVIKGIGGIDDSAANRLLETGIVCNWWRKVNLLPSEEIPVRLTDRNLEWHQNRYSDPDPTEGSEPFHLHTPFISTTAGTVERDAVLRRNILHPAWQVALEFATDIWTKDGYLFYCYLFVLGRPSVSHQPFAEELRELNTYTGFSPFQPEGELTSKIMIPPTQIEKFEFYQIKSVLTDIAGGRRPVPGRVVTNTKHFRPPEDISNIRGLLT